MNANVNWKGNLAFEGVASSGKPVLMDSASDPAQRIGPSPMELVALSLAGCTAMDVISILQKKQQDVTAFQVNVHADRAQESPKVFTRAALEYQVTGHTLNETAVLRAIELSIEKYCSVHAMLSQAFPIDLTYLICEDEGDGMRRVVAEGNFLQQDAE